LVCAEEAGSDHAERGEARDPEDASETRRINLGGALDRELKPGRGRGGNLQRLEKLELSFAFAMGQHGI
jgi:hypothetical protein